MDGFKSVLNLDKIYFEDIKYHNSFSFENQAQSQNYDVRFERNVAVTEDGIHCRVTLKTIIESKSKTISAEITMVGLFTCESENEELKKVLWNDNTVAIMFPYLRSQLSLVTTQPDMAPIVLPPINVAAMFKNGEEIKE